MASFNEYLSLIQKLLKSEEDWELSHSEKYKTPSIRERQSETELNFVPSPVSDVHLTVVKHGSIVGEKWLQFREKEMESDSDYEVELSKTGILGKADDVLEVLKKFGKYRHPIELEEVDIRKVLVITHGGKEWIKIERLTHKDRSSDMWVSRGKVVDIDNKCYYGGTLVCEPPKNLWVTARVSYDYVKYDLKVVRSSENEWVGVITGEHDIQDSMEESWWEPVLNVPHGDEEGY